jgi:hypothetical protein
MAFFLDTLVHPWIDFLRILVWLTAPFQLKDALKALSL